MSENTQEDTYEEPLPYSRPVQGHDRWENAVLLFFLFSGLVAVIVAMTASLNAS